MLLPVINLPARSAIKVMANRHFAELGDVWKHLPLAEVLRLNPPQSYWETHAGSLCYPLTASPTRVHGALRFLKRAPLDPDLIGCYVALTPTWNETAYFADYILPMGHGSERHDIHSYETHDAQWVGFRQPVKKAARQRLGEEVNDTREVNPGEVWEENEFWLDLTWRIDPDGSLGIRQFAESKKKPGERLGVNEYYEWIFENSLPGLPEKAKAEDRTPLEYMRRYGVFEVQKKVGALYEETVPSDELEDLTEDPFGRVFTRAPKSPSPNIVPIPTPDGDQDGRRFVGVRQNGEIKRGFPTPRHAQLRE